MAHTVEEDPPDSNDLPGWQLAVQNDAFRNFRHEAIVAAIRDLYARADAAVITPLAKHLSERMFSLIYGVIGRHYRAEDIAQEAHSRLWEAILQPESADGRGLREAFTPRLRYRVKDVVAKFQSHAVRSQPADGEGGAEGDPKPVPAKKSKRTEIADGALLDGVAAKEDPVGERIDVETVLERISDPRKRLVFRMYMDGVPFKSTRICSIEDAVGVSERTARAWVEEIQEMLGTDPLVQNLQSHTTGGMS